MSILHVICVQFDRRLFDGMGCYFDGKSLWGCNMLVIDGFPGGLLLRTTTSLKWGRMLGPLLKLATRAKVHVGHLIHR